MQFPVTALGRFGWALLLGMLVAPTSTQASLGLKEQLGTLLRQDPVLSHATVAISVRGLDHQETLFSWNDHEPMNPASNIKLVTTAVALRELGLHYQFKTAFSADRAIHNGAVQNLYIKGSGDPLLVNERLWRIAGDFKARGLKEIRGDLVIDDSLFDDVLFPEGWPSDPGPQAYYAPHAAFAANFNTVGVFVFPGEKIGAPVRVHVDPWMESIRVENQGVTAAPHSARTLGIERFPNQGMEIVRISGRLPLDGKPFVKYRNIGNPTLFSGEVFKSILKGRGILVTGRVRRGLAPESAVQIFVEESPPLSHMIQDVNKLSNNFMAEQILKTLAAEKDGPPGSTRKGVARLNQYLTSLKVPNAEFAIQNGSGLSSRTRISASALVRVLEDTWNNPTLRPEFMASLSLGGVDGTLEERNIECSPNGILVRVRGKTGSLRDDGVSTISGYINRKDGETWAFSILMNNLGKRFDHSHRAQERILDILINS